MSQTKRVMIIPAAGLGTRLKSATPKVLFPVNGRPMLDYLLELYAPLVERFILVLHPSGEEAVKDHCARLDLAIEYELQREPTGMLDAILIPQGRVQRHQPSQVWITWCDQIAVRRETAVKLGAEADRPDAAALTMPTVFRPEPYIHLARNEGGVISGILQRREGDELPGYGESDIGLFCLSLSAYLDLLPRFARAAGQGTATQERNFLPFIPWLAGQAAVNTFPVHDVIQSVGINDVADLQQIERYLRDEKTVGDHSRL